MASFGEKTSYVFGEIFRDKFSIPGKAYRIEPVDFECSACPAKVVGDHVQIFFPSPIFNTVVESVEENVSILRSYDEKRTIIKEKLVENKLYTVITIKETDDIREVVLYAFDTLFPGYRSKGRVEVTSGKPRIVTDVGSGFLQLQRNDVVHETECVLYKIDGDELEFAEINRPIKRCTVKVVKDLNRNKIVENGAVKGILVGSKSSLKEQDEVDVSVHRVCLGSYVFIEDLKPGPAVVEVVGKEGNKYTVSYRGFKGTYQGAAASSRMKGRITAVNDDGFVFVRDDDEKTSTNDNDGKETVKKTEKCERNEVQKVREKRKQKEEGTRKENDGNENRKEKKRTYEFEEVNLVKRVQVNSPEEVGDDQYKAIELIRTKMKVADNVIPLFNKYIMSIKENDKLCLFYLKYLEDTERIDVAEVARVLRIGGNVLLRDAVRELNGKTALEVLFRRKKTKKCFIKLLPLVDDKVSFIKDNEDYMDGAIDYIYQTEKKPRPIAESVIGNSYKGWMAYLDNEKGAYKRGLFRRLVENRALKKDEMKAVFEKWLAFEEDNGGDTEEVVSLAKKYVSEKKKAEKDL